MHPGPPGVELTDGEDPLAAWDEFLERQQVPQEFRNSASALEDPDGIGPRLYFQHFTTTSRLAERPDGTLAAFLIGFVSQTDPDTAYIHFVGVDPELHGQGIGRSLYEWFFGQVRESGVRKVKCITSPQNTASRAYHARLGFEVSDVLPDYDGPGLDRVAFTRVLAA